MHYQQQQSSIIVLSKNANVCFQICQDMVHRRGTYTSLLEIFGECSVDKLPLVSQMLCHNYPPACLIAYLSAYLPAYQCLPTSVQLPCLQLPLLACLPLLPACLCCLPACLPACLPVCLSACQLSTCLIACLSAYQTACLHVYLPVRLPV